MYKETSLNTTNPVYYKAPQEAVPLTQTTIPPKKFYPAPVIEKVEMLFSLIARDAHGPWSATSTGLTTFTRMIHLLYAPIITLHNPYNVSLKFDKLDLDINGIPIAFNFFVNGQAQNNEPISYNRMYYSHADRTAKAFMLSISNWSDFSSTSPSPITMKPGQSLVCGPYIDGSTIFGNDGREGERVFSTTATTSLAKPTPAPSANQAFSASRSHSILTGSPLTTPPTPPMAAAAC